MGEAGKQKVAAVVATFNRKQLLAACLQALLNQTYPLDALYIIDNASSDGTPEYLLEKGFIDGQLYPDRESAAKTGKVQLPSCADRYLDVHYVRMYENTGASGGFHEGVRRAYEAGYDWLWIMDDDAEPKHDAMEKLSPFLTREHIGALAPAVHEPDGTISIFHRGYLNLENIFPLIQTPLAEEAYATNAEIAIDAASFVGLFVSRKTIERIGYPKKAFFLHHDDIEYCIRMREAGKILLVPDSIVFHKNEKVKEDREEKKIHFIRGSVPFERYWLTYFGKRNLTWLGKKYGTNRMRFSARLLREYVCSVFDILLVDDHKLKRIVFLTSAYRDGLKGNFDNKKPRQILYG